MSAACVCSLVAALCIFLAFPSQAHAQEPDQYPSAGFTVTAKNSVSLHLVGTFANGSLEGTSNDRRLFLVGAAFNRLLARRSFAELSFTSQLIPFAVLREPYFIGTNIQALRNVPPVTETRKNYGVGASPAGLKVKFPSAQKGAAILRHPGRLFVFQQDSGIAPGVTL